MYYLFYDTTMRCAFGETTHTLPWLHGYLYAHTDQSWIRVYNV